jgi:TFIIF-interacting CTD phosphatase-like protein
MLLEMPGNRVSKIWGLHRPHLYEFLRFASEYFDNILVWSAGIRPYVDEITKQIFLESGLRSPKIVWARDNCFNYQGLYHKPIAEIINELSQRPYTTFKVDPKWTLVVDDKSHTFMQNPHNGILITPYRPGDDRPGKIPLMEDLLDRSDTALLQLKQWLEHPEIRDVQDIRTVDKTIIFK